MRIAIFISALIICMANTSEARETVGKVSIEGLKMEHSGQYMTVDMTLDMSGLKVSRNRAVLITPRLVNGEDSLDLPSVGVYGRNRYYHYVRNGESMLTGKDELSYKASRKPADIAYNKVLPYQEWMNGADLTLHYKEYGCCSKMLAEQTGSIGNFYEEEEFFPELVYVFPTAKSDKTSSIEGSAYIDFPVNKTVIYPDYRRNADELGKIRGTIDSVRNDPDMTITQVWLKGYASPESPYEHNRELAIGRTNALKNYVNQLYHFDNNVIATDYEPEDWAGLRRYVANSNINHKQEILAIIDNDRDPDVKEKMIKTSYPEEYRFLLQECYPSLRHTDYKVAYTIRSYSDVNEIERLLHTQPQKLSLNEFYLLAQKYKPGTDEFTEVYETAVRMYPADATANLNAANAAMRRGDNEQAARYLAKAGDSPEAVYARGALAIRNGDYDKARIYLGQAEKAGVKQARVIIDQLDKGRRI